MISKGKDYDSVTSFGQGEFKTLKPGGYICRILKAEEMTSSSGKQMLHIAFDICEGDNIDFFNDLFKARKKANTDPLKTVKWPFEGQAWIPINDYEDPNKTSRKFKGFCTAVEDSGTEIWDLDGNLDLDKLVQAEVGVVFQDVEKEYNGKTSWRALPWGFRSIASIATGDYFVPEPKELPITQNTGFESADSFNAASDPIPF